MEGSSKLSALRTFLSKYNFMVHQKISIAFDEYDSVDQLSEEDAALLIEAQKAIAIAYAPYSKFRVGAAALLQNGKTLLGSNQENASYPVGMCAERVLLSTTSSLFPGIPIKAIAISYRNELGESIKPISPCGICRQTLVEYESMLKYPIRLILAGMEGKIVVLPNAGTLLPFGFSGKDLQ